MTKSQTEAPTPGGTAPRHAMALLAFVFSAAWFVTEAMAAHLPRLLEAAGATPAAAVFVLLHGAGNGVLTIVKGTLPLAIFGPEGYGLRQGLLGAPSRFIQACAPFLFGLMIDWYGAGSVVLSAACCLSAFVALMVLRPAPLPAPALASR